MLPPLVPQLDVPVSYFRGPANGLHIIDTVQILGFVWRKKLKVDPAADTGQTGHQGIPQMLNRVGLFQNAIELANGFSGDLVL